MISVIIPVLNEAHLLYETLQSVSVNTYPHELLVVDGGSSDASIQIAMASGVRVIHSPIKQRAAQMNLGAREARGHTLLFLHADTLLSSQSLTQVAQSVVNRGAVSGAFTRRFDYPSHFLRISCWLSDLRSYLLGIHLGDQGIFVKTEVFHQLGGFREMDCFEDLDLSLRLRKRGRSLILRPPITSSGRRFEYHGPIRQTLKDFWSIVKFMLSKNET